MSCHAGKVCGCDRGLEFKVNGIVNFFGKYVKAQCGDKMHIKTLQNIKYITVSVCMTGDFRCFL